MVTTRDPSHQQAGDPSREEPDDSWNEESLRHARRRRRRVLCLRRWRAPVPLVTLAQYNTGRHVTTHLSMARDPPYAISVWHVTLHLLSQQGM
eukprot:3938272-Rhodomonas_salina.2